MTTRSIPPMAAKSASSIYMQVSLKLVTMDTVRDTAESPLSSNFMMDSKSENASATDNNGMPPPPPNTSQTTKHVPHLPPKSKRKRPNKQTSFVWDHFKKMQASANDEARCKCNYCSKDYACDSNSCGTSTLWKHLRNQRKKYPYREEDKGQITLTLVPTNDGKGANATTRWNSTYLMLEHAIRFEKDFKILEKEKESSDFVEYFEEGDRGNKRFGPPNVSYWLTDINKIQFILNKWSNNNNSVLSLMAMNMKTKFDKCWGSLEKMNKLMFVAMVIDPRYKLKCLNYCLSDVCESDVKDVVESEKIYLYRLYDFYKSQHNHSTQIGYITDDLKQSNNVTREVEKDEEVNPWITFYALREEESSMEVEKDLTFYLSDKDVVDKDEFDIMYWRKMNGYKYPILSKIVRDVLAILISIVASESAFSTGGRILDTFRSSLTPTTVESSICTQNWIRGGSVLLDLHPQLEELETYENIETGNSSSSIILD
ncbi:zinc finger BED domain-containing protein RICESLEEPER 2-like isoform X2 [Cucumis melo var. makuwa]|uniref:Zinc finger BED domain-containing protein RICESLEEPER 2-like isoform X2 n=1 Tax=Cucumis melo var. makuwa TaxID=1194695 RepID=A0A5D3BZE7_CUCMM|nr:zinc finger BED domain-containing protein RICESLEEPER 2-like isoform X2 [Cucumis melo var. makuwa]TYK04388.1 zinc finger BED domain-containing protein RICESLEEPER 2-like isoform X2 [Cucumis melo var. makuwa]